MRCPHRNVHLETWDLSQISLCKWAPLLEKSGDCPWFPIQDPNTCFVFCPALNLCTWSRYCLVGKLLMSAADILGFFDGGGGAAVTAGAAAAAVPPPPSLPPSESSSAFLLLPPSPPPTRSPESRLTLSKPEFLAKTRVLGA